MSKEENSKAKLYLYLDTTSKAHNSYESTGWVEVVDLPLEMYQRIQKISLLSDTWGSNSVVPAAEDNNRLVAKYMNLCEAMFTDKEQREAWKSIIKSTFYEWQDEMFNRHHVNEDDFKKGTQPKVEVEQ